MIAPKKSGKEKAPRGSDPDWPSLTRPPFGKGCQGPRTHPQVTGAPWTLEHWGLGGWGLALTPPRCAPRVPQPVARSPVLTALG